MKPSRCGGYIRTTEQPPQVRNGMNTSQLAALRWMMERELSALRSPRMSPEISLKCPDENELASRLSERAVDERLTAGASSVSGIWRTPCGVSRSWITASVRRVGSPYRSCGSWRRLRYGTAWLASRNSKKRSGPWSSPDHLTLRVPGVQCRRVPSHRLCPFSCPGADRQAIDSSRINGFF